MGIYKTFLLAALALIPVRAFSTVFPDTAKLKINERNPALVNVRVTYTLPKGEFCIYWPLNNPPEFRDHLPIKGLDLWYQRTARTHLTTGRMDIRSNSDNMQQIDVPGPFYFTKFQKSDDKPLSIDFDAMVPRQPFFKPNEIIYHDYLPVINDKCSTRVEKNFKSETWTIVDAPKGWEVLSPFRLPDSKDGMIKLKGFHSNFVIGTEYKTETLRARDLDIKLYYRTQEYRKLLPVIKKTLTFYGDKLGKLPLNKLLIFESDHTTQSDIMGLIAYLKPRQEFLKSLQEYWLNWSEWAVTAALGYQWFGSMLEPDHENDSWLIHSLRDFYVLKALQQDPNALNLFNSYNQTLFDFKYTYSEFQDLTAFSLISTTPKAILTHENLKSFTRLRHQNPLLFIRNVMALRNLETIVGFKRLNLAIKKFFPVGGTPKHISPPVFASGVVKQLEKSSPKQAKLINQTLLEWWTKSGWPDRSLQDHKVSKIKQNEYLVEIEVEEKGQLQTPSDIVLWDVKGKKYTLSAASQTKKSQRVILANDLDRIEIDPQKEVFDQNRFNNSSEVASFYFFPGGARELYQDSYTVFWFPYLIKRPGEDLRLGAQSTILKYLRGNFLLYLETDKAGKNTTFDFVHEQETSIPGVQYFVGLQKDFYNQRLASLKLNFKDINSSTIHPLHFFVTARGKQEGSDSKTLHGTFSLGFNLLPGWRPEPCNFSFQAEHEQTPSEQGEEKIHYQRSFGILSFLCNITEKAQMRTRLFRGVTKTLVTAPRNSYFWPQNLGEAKIRFDYPPAEPHSFLNSFSQELNLPLYFPFDIGSYVLTQKMKLRLFFDYGEASRQTIYRSGGFGFILPLGGDVSGAGSLSITKLSFLSAVYQTTNDERHPTSYLFDITGEL